MSTISDQECQEYITKCNPYPLDLLDLFYFCLIHSYAQWKLETQNTCPIAKPHTHSMKYGATHCTLCATI